MQTMFGLYESFNSKIHVEEEDKYQNRLVECSDWKRPLSLLSPFVDPTP